MDSYLKGRPSPARAGSIQTEQKPVPPLSKIMSAPARKVHGDHGTPEVECIKQGNRVTRIIVTCGCGERIEIDCVYPDTV